VWIVGEAVQQNAPMLQDQPSNSNPCGELQLRAHIQSLLLLLVSDSAVGILYRLSLLMQHEFFFEKKHTS